MRNFRYTNEIAESRIQEKEIAESSRVAKSREE